MFSGSLHTRYCQTRETGVSQEDTKEKMVGKRKSYVFQPEEFVAAIFPHRSGSLQQLFEGC